MKIVIDDKIPFIRGVFEPFADVLYLPGKKTTPETVADADALITRTRTICNETLLKASKVRVIATATIGFDHIDTSWCERNAIVWRNAPGCNSWSVKQYISSVLITLAAKHSLNLEGMTLGVVGVGNVGSKVADVGKALGMKVLLNDPPRARKEGEEGFVSLDKIIESSDIITLHVPLEKAGEDPTWHLINAQRLASMRSNQILINSSRGPVVDNMALKESLLNHSILAAALDVWEGEPELDPCLVNLLDVTTPHIAGYSADGKANGTTMSVRTVAEILGIGELSQWNATGIPAPSFGRFTGEDAFDFTIDCIGKTPLKILSEAILHCYDVSLDSDSLKRDIGMFEKLRGDYPVRREPSSYNVHLENANPEIIGKVVPGLKLLDFNIR